MAYTRIKENFDNCCSKCCFGAGFGCERPDHLECGDDDGDYYFIKKDPITAEQWMETQK